MFKQIHVIVYLIKTGEGKLRKVGRVPGAQQTEDWRSWRWKPG